MFSMLHSEKPFDHITGFINKVDCLQNMGQYIQVRIYVSIDSIRIWKGLNLLVRNVTDI